MVYSHHSRWRRSENLALSTKQKLTFRQGRVEGPRARPVDGPVWFLWSPRGCRPAVGHPTPEVALPYLPFLLCIADHSAAWGCPLATSELGLQDKGLSGSLCQSTQNSCQGKRRHQQKSLRSDLESVCAGLGHQRHKLTVSERSADST